MEGARSATTGEGSLRRRRIAQPGAPGLRPASFVMCSAFAVVEDTGYFIIHVSYFTAFNQPLTSFIN
jgi:hypothetical protein